MQEGRHFRRGSYRSYSRGRFNFNRGHGSGMNTYNTNYVQNENVDIESDDE